MPAPGAATSSVAAMATTLGHMRQDNGATLPHAVKLLLTMLQYAFYLGAVRSQALQVG